jgi:hypothetical protein
MLGFDQRVLKLLLFISATLAVIGNLSSPKDDPHTSPPVNSDSRRVSSDDEDDLSDPDEFERKLYLGRWEIDNSHLGSFKQQEGRSYLVAKYDTINVDVRAVLMLFDGDWEDDPMSLIVLPHASFDQANRSMSFVNMTLGFYEESGLSTDSKP